MEAFLFFFVTITVVMMIGLFSGRLYEVRFKEGADFFGGLAILVLSLLILGGVGFIGLVNELAASSLQLPLMALACAAFLFCFFFYFSFMQRRQPLGF